MNMTSGSEHPLPLERIVQLTGLYLVAVVLTLAMAAPGGDMLGIWFAGGIGTVTLLAQPPARWLLALPLLGLADLLAHGLILTLTHGPDPAILRPAATFVLAHLVEMTLAASLLRRLQVSASVFVQPVALSKALVLGALLPAIPGAFIAGTLSSMATQQTYADLWLQWLITSVVGSVASLPFALVVWLQGWRSLAELLRMRSIGLLVLSGAITLVALTTLSHPFVITASALVLVAVQASFVLTAVATLLTAGMLALLHVTAILLPPTTVDGWGSGLYQLSHLATLLPGLLLSAAIGGQSQTLRQLQASERRFRTLYTRTPAMMHSIDASGRIATVSRLWLQTLGYAEHEVLGRLSTDFMTRESARYAREVLIPQSMRDGRFDQIPLQMVTHGGQVLDVLLSAVWAYDRHGTPLHNLTVVQDVTAKKRLEALSHYAQHDPLTGLPNRKLLQDRLERHCAQHERHGTRFAVAFLDLDHFKETNDHLGHEAGDRLLKQVAARLQEALRASDTVSRFAGDEFVLLLSEVDRSNDLEPLARKILANVAQPCRLDNAADAPEVNVEASMGIAIFPEHGRDAQTLLAHADQAMYEAKRSGRNQFRFYEPSK